MADFGSSPLTRGKHAVLVSHVEARGLIPAHAGKTRTSAPAYSSPSAHPRSRGENINAVGAGFGASGSSPLTRGKPHSARVIDVGRRLIPAHAGKTTRPPTRHETSPAHPRSRGENDLRGLGDPLPGGSSPLTRGKLSLSGVLGEVDRLIPAHAGKTKYRAPSGRA